MNKSARTPSAAVVVVCFIDKTRFCLSLSVLLLIFICLSFCLSVCLSAFLPLISIGWVILWGCAKVLSISFWFPVERIYTDICWCWNSRSLSLSEECSPESPDAIASRWAAAEHDALAVTTTTACVLFFLFLRTAFLHAVRHIQSSSCYYVWSSFLSLMSV